VVFSNSLNKYYLRNQSLLSDYSSTWVWGQLTRKSFSVGGFLIHNSFYYHFCLAKVRKTAQKALGKAQKLGAEGVGLNSG
jgi:hypothetical protein